ncbi:unannotated protein [freshwater metagenome]|uniref:Unannotated protein n=1 Tax=freshwater metagenome TaxID=449393 RepID=A0A6J6MDF3_9ZZZZ
MATKSAAPVARAFSANSSSRFPTVMIGTDSLMWARTAAAAARSAPGL